MSCYVTDAGSRYIVKNENLEAAYAWLENEGEFAYAVGHGEGVTYLSADGNEDMWCGNMAWGGMYRAKDFIEKFCEPGSYACFYTEDCTEYDMMWRDTRGVHSECRGRVNPFWREIEELENEFETA